MLLGAASRRLWAPALTKTFCHKVEGQCKLCCNILSSQLFDCAVGHLKKKCCDCVVGGSEVWTWFHQWDSHNKGLLLKNNSIFGMHHVPLLQNGGMFHACQVMFFYETRLSV